MKKLYVTGCLMGVEVVCRGTLSPVDSLGAYDSDDDSQVWLIVSLSKNQLQSG